MKKRDEKFTAATEAISAYLALFDPDDEVPDGLDFESGEVVERLIAATYTIEAAVRNVARP